MINSGTNICLIRTRSFFRRLVTWLEVLSAEASKKVDDIERHTSVKLIFGHQPFSGEQSHDLVMGLINKILIKRDEKRQNKSFG